MFARVLTKDRSVQATFGRPPGSSLALALVVLGADQLSKRWAADVLSGNPDGGPTFLDGWVSLTFTTNSGAAFGLLAERGILFLLIGLVVLAVTVAYWRYLPGDSLALRASLGLQLGGAAGNLLDRVRDGYVVDFIEIRYWPVFNLADASILAGVLILIVHLLRGPTGTRRAGPGQQ